MGQPRQTRRISLPESTLDADILIFRQWDDLKGKTVGYDSCDDHHVPVDLPKLQE